MIITSKQTQYPWLKLTLVSDNTTIEEDIHEGDLADFIIMLEGVLDDARRQLGDSNLLGVKLVDLPQLGDTYATLAIPT